jgi:translation initiation factor 1
MSQMCDVCGLPKEICVCEEIAREQQEISIYTVARRYGKMVTVVEGIDSADIDVGSLCSELKGACACGGTTKNGAIELQGDHKQKVKQVLERMGFNAEFK